MKNLWRQIIDTCYDKDNGLKGRMLISVLLIVVGLIIITWFLITLLGFNGHWNIHHKINLPDAGQIGDFVGGLSGTLFTLVGIILLFETLALQRTELSESRKVFEKQQFENTFFNLLSLYKEVKKSLANDQKDFFGEHRKKFNTDFRPANQISKSKRRAEKDYIWFYVTYKEQTSHYFITLYRIFRFVSDSEFDYKTKMSYAKIVRAQLSQNELFFIHYNAYSEYGLKFRSLINLFNIVKHLPLLEKVEFKKYLNQTPNQMQKNGIHLVVEDLKRFIKETLESQKEKYKTYLQGTISIKVNSESPSNLKITIIKKENIKIHSEYQQGFGLDVFDKIYLKGFFSDFIEDLLIYSNYHQFNVENQMTINTKLTDFSESDKYTIEIEIAKKDNQKIRVHGMII